MQEDFLKSCYRNSIAADTKAVHILVEVLEKLCEPALCFFRHPKGDLRRNFLDQFCLPKMLIQVGQQLFVLSFFCFDHSQLVASTESFLEEQARTKTLQLAVCHDRNPISQDVRLVHVVCGQDDDPVVSVIL